MNRVDQRFVVMDFRDEYLRALRPLFSQHAQVDSMELILALVRAGGMEDVGWDPLEESRAFVDDVGAFIDNKIVESGFVDPEATRWRLALVAYAHLVEMDAPYDMLGNLLRIRTRRKFSVRPFLDLETRKTEGRKPNGPPPPGPGKKLPKLRDLAALCGMSVVTEAFDQFYSAPLRNAISHSDFILHGTTLRARKSYFENAPGGKMFAPSIELNRLQEILSRAFCFYSAFFELELQARRAFCQLKGRLFQYDLHYKGILELLFEKDVVCGVAVHWPNGTTSRMRRGSHGGEATNIVFDREGGVEPMIGVLANDPGEYSPLVERGAEPLYQRTDDGADVTWALAQLPSLPML